MSEQLELPVEAPSSADPQTLITPAWYGLKQQVKHLAQFGGSVQVVHAPEGGGKSTFLRFLCEADDFAIVPVDAAQQPDLASLLSTILDELGWSGSPDASVGELIMQLRSFVQHLDQGQERTVVAVDNADRLDDAALAALVSVLQGVQDMGFGLHWLFLAKPGLAERIDQLQLLDVAVSDAALPHFSPSELKTLFQLAVKHKRLAAAVPVEQVQRLWVQSSGLPGVALACAGAMQAERAATKTVWQGGWPFGHIAALAILVTVLIWALLVRDQSGSTSDNALAEREREVQRLVIPAEPVFSTPNSTAEANSQLPSPDKTAQANSAAPKAPEQERSVPVEASQSSALLNEDTAEAGANLVSLDSKNVQSPEGRTNAGSTSIPSESREPQPPTSIERSAAASEVAVEPSATADELPQTPAAQQNIQTAPEVPALGGAGATDEAALLSLPGDGYVLQVMALGSVEKLREYVQAQPNKAQLKIYRGLRNGRLLYILVEGFYGNRSAAQAGILSLPANQAKSGPWPKSLTQIHAEIRDVQRQGDGI